MANSRPWWQSKVGHRGKRRPWEERRMSLLAAATKRYEAARAAGSLRPKDFFWCFVCERAYFGGTRPGRHCLTPGCSSEAPYDIKRWDRAEPVIPEHGGYYMS